MGNNSLPNIMDVKEVANYFRVKEDVVLGEIETGRLKGFKIGSEWRISDEEILAYMGMQKSIDQSDGVGLATVPQTNGAGGFKEILPFDFNWPGEGGEGFTEHYDKGYEATRKINGRDYTFRLGFGWREAAGQKRRRITIWIGNRAIVELAGSNNYDKDKLVAGIIRLPNNRQLTPQGEVPKEYRDFKVVRYDSIVQGPRASKNMAVVVNENNLDAMLRHAIIRSVWKELV